MIRFIRDDEDLHMAMKEASEIEHGLMCQYLYAAFSIKLDGKTCRLPSNRQEYFRQAKRELLYIARQEMSHLATMANLLSLTGQKPHFLRPSFPQPKHSYGGYRGLGAFQLTPFSLDTIKRFKDFEKPPDSSRWIINRLLSVVYPTVGDLYRNIEGTIGSRHLTGTNEYQIREKHIQGQAPGMLSFYDMRIWSMETLDNIKEEIRIIREQGEGKTDNSKVDGHYEIFVQMEKDYSENESDLFTDIASNPTLSQSTHDSQQCVIENPATKQVAELFNIIYSFLIVSLYAFYLIPELRSRIRRIIFFPFMSGLIRPLGEIICSMPVKDNSTNLAGPTFDLDPGLTIPMDKPAYEQETIKFMDTVREKVMNINLGSCGNHEFVSRLRSVLRNLTYLTNNYSKDNYYRDVV